MESRKRCANFTSEEKIAVLSLIKEKKDILECKKSDAVTWKQKEDIWDEITSRFNASNPVLAKRSKENLKKFYENKKKEVRKLAAKERVEKFKTGGGSATPSIDDPTFDLTMSILNKKSVLGLPSVFDCDVEENEENIYFKIVSDNENDPEPVEFQQQNVQHPSILDWGDFKAENLRGPISKELQTNTNGKVSTSRRRPQMSSTGNLAKKYEELAEIKKELGLLQVEILKNEKEARQEKHKEEMEQLQLKRKRDEEEFLLKKELAKLDIEIKKKQLEALQNF